MIDSPEEQSQASPLQLALIEKLIRLHPDTAPFLESETPFQLLIAVILSAQCTDTKVNEVTRVLFRAFPTPTRLAGAPLADVEKIVYPTGFYREKAAHIVETAGLLLQRHEGQVPLGMAELTQIQMASAKASQAAQSVADLVSRYSSGYTDPKGFSDLEAAATTMIAPLATSSGNPLVGVVSATLNSSGTPTIAWKCSTGTMPASYSISTLLSAAPALTTQNSSLSSVIMVTVSYVYSPTISGGITGPQTFTATAYSAPRTVMAIPNPC